MASSLDRAKRALVALLRALASAYSLELNVTRDSEDAGVRRAYRNVSRRAHPDRGGKVEDQKKLNAAHDAWQEALRAHKGRHGGWNAGRPDEERLPLATESPTLRPALCVMLSQHGSHG